MNFWTTFARKGPLRRGGLWVPEGKQGKEARLHQDPDGNTMELLSTEVLA